MSLVPVARLIGDARRGGYAVGYFESWNVESLAGVIDAAEQVRSPILIGFNGEFLTRPQRLAAERIEWYATVARAAAQSASVPVGMLFNECSRDECIRQAILAGFSQAMLDDPDASADQCIRRVRDLAAFAHQDGAIMEAEVGELSWGADAANTGHGQATDPDAAAAFVDQTGVDLIAVSVGNVHALADGRRNLDLELLAAIAKRVNVPLDLHGGTGIADGSLREAIGLGVAKVCYGTYLKRAYLDTIRKALACDEPDPHKLLGMGGPQDVMTAGRLAVRDAVLERIGALGSVGQAKETQSGD